MSSPGRKGGRSKGYVRIIHDTYIALLKHTYDIKNDLVINRGAKRVSASMYTVTVYKENICAILSED